MLGLPNEEIVDQGAVPPDELGPVAGERAGQVRGPEFGNQLHRFLPDLSKLEILADLARGHTPEPLIVQQFPESGPGQGGRHVLGMNPQQSVRFATGRQHRSRAEEYPAVRATRRVHPEERPGQVGSAVDVAPHQMLPARYEFRVEPPERDHANILRDGPGDSICLQAGAVHGHPGLDGPSVGPGPGAVRSVDQGANLDAIPYHGAVGLSFLEHAANECLGIEAGPVRCPQGGDASRVGFEGQDSCLVHQLRAYSVPIGAMLELV